MTSNPPTNITSLDASSSRTESTPNSESLQLDTFIHFPHLPKELRLSIWELALPKGRILSIHRTDDQLQRELTLPRFTLQQSKLPLLQTCHESRITALRGYQPRKYKQLGHPYYFDQKSDVILLNGVEIIGKFCYDTSPPFTMVRGIIQNAGVSLARRGCHGSFAGQVLVGSFWRTVVIYKLYSLIDVIGTLETLFVFHPRCLGTGLDAELKAKVEAKKKLKRQSSNVGGPDITMPLVIFQAYEDDLDYQGAERGLRELMEKHDFQK